MRILISFALTVYRLPSWQTGRLVSFANVVGRSSGEDPLTGYSCGGFCGAVNDPTVLICRGQPAPYNSTLPKLTAEITLELNIAALYPHLPVFLLLRARFTRKEGLIAISLYIRIFREISTDSGQKIYVLWYFDTSLKPSKHFASKLSEV